VELKDAASGKRIDLAKARFGFRESWMQADKLFFNGHQVRLKGGGADAPYTGVSKAYSQLERDAVAPDFSDEVGSLVTHRPTGLVNSSTKHNVERDIFWETCESNTLRAMKRKWNHPCIIAWDLSNEWFVFAPYSGCDMNQAADRFMSLNSAVDKADPSRWTFFNGDYDIGGRHYNISAHYMLGAARFGYEFDGHSVYMPDGAFLRPLDKDYLPGEEIVLGLHQNLRWKMGSKVLMDNENLWKVGSAMPPGTSRYAGEDVVLSPIVDESTGQMIWMWKQDFDSHRDLGAAVHSNHDSKPGTVTRAHMLQTFIMPDVAHHAFSGVKLERKYSILNDLFRSAQMSFRWRLVGPDGKISQQGADERKMNSAETHRSSLSFTAPKVSQRTTFMLELRLYSDGEFACGEDRDIEIWPDSSIPVGALARKIYLYDPKGDTAVVLKAALCEFESLKAITAPEGDPARSVVVIGEGALDKESAQDIAKLASFADAGGRILILAQKVAPQGLPARLALESREWTSQPYVRVPIHPIFSGNPRSEISSWDLHFWAPDRVSSRGAYTKPFGGSCITLVDAGDEKGLEWVQMMELYRGKGNYFLSQFPLVANYYQEPMARELLSSTLKYAGGKDLFRSPINKLGLIAQKNGELEQRLKSLRADYELLGPETVPASGGIYMVEGGIVPDAQAITVWKKGLSDGATIVLCNARPEDAAWIENLAGKHVRITVPKYRMWEGRGYRDGFDPLTAGLSHLDLFWKKYFWNGHTSESPEYIIEQYQNASAEIPAARELIFPGALLDLKVGSGRLVLDQRRLTTDQQSLKGMAKRNLATLLLGLNVAIAPAPVKPELPRDITLRPIDISPYANRALFDDVGEDGKGGWSDQGPDTDLRSFPTGEQDFHGVPFAIGNSDRSIIVLASENRPDKQNLPLEVTVPIASKVEGLYFLHSSAYSGGEVALYEIEYEDGKTIEIPLVSDENIRDWASYNTGDFPNDNETETVVAWTGTCKMFKKISAFMMLWVNPHPETPVKSVRFVNKRKKCVPMLIGMTAAIRRDPVETSANLARAQEILKDAKIKLEEKKNDIAKKLLNEAVSISPELMEAQEMLADICEKAGNEDELIRTYRRWTRANPHTPGPWNRLGELLEKRKDYKGALEAYKRSLEVEWNQPPIIEAKTRMDKIPRD